MPCSATTASSSRAPPRWPAHRQPAVDRAILRLACYELRQEGSQPKVVINEAVEMAKRFSTEKSAAFVNGILGKVFRALKGEDPQAQPQAQPQAEPPAQADEP